MAKKFESTARFVKPDWRFQNLLAQKFINAIMRQGKKAVAEGVFYRAMNEVESVVKEKPPIDVFKEAVENVKPVVEVRSRRVGGATYQVPVEVRPNRRQSLAIRWILEAARAKKGKPMHRKLAEELIDAYRRQGAAYTSRENVHRMAEANKAFAHFAWGRTR